MQSHKCKEALSVGEPPASRSPGTPPEQQKPYDATARLQAAFATLAAAHSSMSTPAAVAAHESNIRWLAAEVLNTAADAAAANASRAAAGATAAAAKAAAAPATAAAAAAEAEVTTAAAAAAVAAAAAARAVAVAVAPWAPAKAQKELFALVNMALDSGVCSAVGLPLSVVCSHMLGERAKLSFGVFGCAPEAHGALQNTSFVTRAMIAASLVPLGHTLADSMDIYRTLMTSLLQTPTVDAKDIALSANLPFVARAIAFASWYPAAASFRRAAFVYLVALPQLYEIHRLTPSSSVNQTNLLRDIFCVAGFADDLVTTCLSGAHGEQWIASIYAAHSALAAHQTTLGFIDEQVGLLHPQWVAREQQLGVLYKYPMHDRMVHELVAGAINQLPADLLQCVMEFAAAPMSSSAELKRIFTNYSLVHRTADAADSLHAHVP
jgi:hypothetical protein